MTAPNTGILPGGCTDPRPSHGAAEPWSAAGRGRTVLVLTYRWPPQGGQ